MADADPRPGTPAEPAFSRRREVAATSARSLLLTVLGEFVLPRRVPVWTQTLVDVLALVGVEEKSARQALARTAADGVVVSTRQGRRVHWSLSESSERLLTEGAERIYAHGLARAAWDGQWLVLLASVPEHQRQVRHQLRTRLAWVGLGSPSAGVWVCPAAERLDEVRSVLDDVGVAGSTFVFVGPYRGAASPADLVAQAWDLADLEACYEEFVTRFADVAPTDAPSALAAQIRLVDAWRRFPFLDPQLPGELLPDAWIGERAAELFHARHSAWRDPAARAWEVRAQD